jgi:hypothetical protein
MMQMMDRSKSSAAAPLRLDRSWAWVIAGFGVTAVYAAVFSRTLHL